MTLKQLAQAERDQVEALRYFAVCTRLGQQIFDCNNPMVVKYKNALRVLARHEEKALRKQFNE